MHSITHNERKLEDKLREGIAEPSPATQGHRFPRVPPWSGPRGLRQGTLQAKLPHACMIQIHAQCASQHASMRIMQACASCSMHACTCTVTCASCSMHSNMHACASCRHAHHAACTVTCTCNMRANTKTNKGFRRQQTPIYVRGHVRASHACV